MTDPLDIMKQRLVEAIDWTEDPDDPDGTEELCNLIDAVEAYLINLSHSEDSSREHAECTAEFLASKGIFDEEHAVIMMLYPFTPCPYIWHTLPKGMRIESCPGLCGASVS